MQLGMIGLGRMGANMVRRLLKNGHECVVYDTNPDSVAALVASGRYAPLLIQPPMQFEVWGVVIGSFRRFR